eukprot:TRINITY_DN19304_c0_g1_i1.p1 TRINITY_DN19304_c0_g1~~TRINITY_DN19304_c0_g1_i1.p1  ORF type:complete len:871 (+),score=288.73 TRINITY_DN19304_c0_g1_i1:42-2615(+)
MAEDAPAAPVLLSPPQQPAAPMRRNWRSQAPRPFLRPEGEQQTEALEARTSIALFNSPVSPAGSVTEGMLGPEDGPLGGVVQEVRRYVEEQALNRLRVLWMPQMRLHLQRVRRRMAVQRISDAERREVECVLEKSALCRTLAPEAVRRLLAQGTPMNVPAGKVLVHQGETAASGLWVVVAGAVSAFHRPPSTPDQDDSNRPKPQHVCVHTAPAVLGELSVITSEAWVVSIVSKDTLTETRVWVIPARAVSSEFSALAPQVRKDVYEQAFRQRAENLRNTAPMSVADARRARLFDNLTDSEIATLVSRLHPRCCQSGSLICKSGDVATEMYFLKCGIAEIRAQHMQAPQQLLPGACFGDMAYIFGRRRNISVHCLSHCDVWVLRFDDLDAVVARGNDMRGKIMRAAQARRREGLNIERGRDGTVGMLCSYLRRSAVIGEGCTDACLRELALALEPTVHMPGDVVVSSVDTCDRLLVVAQGRLRVQQSAVADLPPVEHGDVVGFTCAARHRWLFAVVALSGCDVWSVHRERMAMIVARHGCLSTVAELTRLRLCSEVYEPLPAVLGRREVCPTRLLAEAAARCCAPSRLLAAGVPLDAPPAELHLAKLRRAACSDTTEPPLLHGVPGLRAAAVCPVQKMQPPDAAMRMQRRFEAGDLSPVCGSPQSPRKSKAMPPRPQDNKRPVGSRRCWIVGGAPAADRSQQMRSPRRCSSSPRPQNEPPSLEVVSPSTQVAQSPRARKSVTSLTSTSFYATLSPGLFSSTRFDAQLQEPATPLSPAGTERKRSRVAVQAEAEEPTSESLRNLLSGFDNTRGPAALPSSGAIRGAGKKPSRCAAAAQPLRPHAGPACSHRAPRIRGRS